MNLVEREASLSKLSWSTGNEYDATTILAQMIIWYYFNPLLGLPSAGCVH